MTLEELHRTMVDGFRLIDERFAAGEEHNDQRFAANDQRFSGIDQRFDRMDERFDRSSPRPNPLPHFRGTLL